MTRFPRITAGCRDRPVVCRGRPRARWVWHRPSIVPLSADPGSLKSLRVEQAATGKPVLLRGRDARQQLCVTGVYRRVRCAI